MPTIIATPKASDANSYISEVDAGVYFTNKGVPAMWIAATTTQKQEALIAGTQYLDAKYTRSWRGIKTISTQRLAWPRQGIWDYDGLYVDENIIPRNVQEACAEAAVRSLSGELIDETGTIKAESIRVGEIETSTEYMGGKSSRSFFTLVAQLLTDFIGGASFDRS